MKRSRKSKRISWASGVNLCQVKLFSTEDFPSEVGQKFQNHLQAKASRMFHSSSTEVQDLPPGFEQSLFSNQPELRLPHIPQVHWKCPPKFVLSSSWRVASGEESVEAKVQSYRNARMLEAHYPRFSAIPSSPLVSLDIEKEHNDDSRTPVVPLIPIEETEGLNTPNDIEPEVNTIKSKPASLSQVLLPSGTSTISKSNSSAPESLSNSQPAFGNLPDSGPDVTAAAAAAAAVAAFMTNNEKGSLIDTDLLIQILSDPKIIQNIITDGPVISSGSAFTNTFNQPRSGLSMVAPVPNPITEERRPAVGNLSDVLDRFRSNSTRVQPEAGLKQDAPSVPISLPESAPTPVIFPRPTNGNSFPMPNQVRSNENIISATKNTDVVSSSLLKQALPLKDVNYYKNLVRQHGEEKKVIQNETLNNSHFQDLKMVQNSKIEYKPPKNSKPCIYFKSPKGCRNGVNCPFEHDMSLHWKTGSMLEAHSAKRMKFSGEISGRT